MPWMSVSSSFAGGALFSPDVLFILFKTSLVQLYETWWDLYLLNSFEWNSSIRLRIRWNSWIRRRIGVIRGSICSAFIGCSPDLSRARRAPQFVCFHRKCISSLRIAKLINLLKEEKCDDGNIGVEQEAIGNFLPAFNINSSSKWRLATIHLAQVSHLLGRADVTTYHEWSGTLCAMSVGRCGPLVVGHY